MTENEAVVTETETVQRRRFMRGGALLAAAGAGAVVAGATSALPAQAANGDPVNAGATTTATLTTTLTQTSAANPTLALANPSGPVLKLQVPTTEFTGTLDVGEIANTADGPLIGVSDGTASGSQTTILATGADLDALPLAQAISPFRLLDTRSSAGRAGILRTSSSSALDSAGRLRSGEWVDVLVDSATADFTLSAGFFNLTATGATSNGLLLACPPVNPIPEASTLNFVKGVTLANGCFVQLGIVGTSFAVRVYARLATGAATHVLLDLNGAISASGAPSSSSATTRRLQARRASRRIQRSYSGRR